MSSDEGSSDCSTDSDEDDEITSKVFEKYTHTQEEERAQRLIDEHLARVHHADLARKKREAVAKLLRDEITKDNCKKLGQALTEYMSNTWEPGEPEDEKAGGEEKSGKASKAGAASVGGRKTLAGPSAEGAVAEAGTPRQMLSRVHVLRRTIEKMTQREEELVAELRQVRSTVDKQDAQIKALQASVDAHQHEVAQTANAAEVARDRMYESALQKFAASSTRRVVAQLFRTWHLFVLARKRCRRLFSRYSGERSTAAVVGAWQQWQRVAVIVRERRMQFASKVVGQWAAEGAKGGGSLDLDDALQGSFTNIARITGTVEGLQGDSTSAATANGVTMACSIQAWCDDATSEFKALPQAVPAVLTLCPGDSGLEMMGWVHIEEGAGGTAGGWVEGALEKVSSNPYFRLKRGR